MEWKLSESSAAEQPSALDKTSSNYVVYARKNFEQVEKTNEDGSTYKVWQYQEMIIPKEDWDVLSTVINLDTTVDATRADVDYLLIMSEEDE